MKIEVIKRDGRKVPFKKNLIMNAIKAAGMEVYAKDFEALDRFLFIASYMTDDIVLSIKRKLFEHHERSIDVETIQDIVEAELLESDYPKVAQAYIRYREHRTNARKNTIDDVVNEITDGNNDYWTNENSNKNATLVTTQRDYVAGAVSTDQAKRVLLPSDVVKAHEQGIIHFHKDIVA